MSRYRVKYLEVGDVFQLKHKMRVFTSIEKRYVFLNTPDDRTGTLYPVHVGEYVQLPTVKSLGSEIIPTYHSVDPSRELDTSSFVGHYVVEDVTETHSDNIREYRVRARQLKLSGQYDRNGRVIFFWQDHSEHRAQIRPQDAPVIRKMRRVFVD